MEKTPKELISNVKKDDDCKKIGRWGERLVICIKMTIDTKVYQRDFGAELGAGGLV